MSEPEPESRQCTGDCYNCDLLDECHSLGIWETLGDMPVVPTNEDVKLEPEVV